MLGNGADQDSMIHGACGIHSYGRGLGIGYLISEKDVVLRGRPSEYRIHQAASIWRLKKSKFKSRYHILKLGDMEC